MYPHKKKSNFDDKTAHLNNMKLKLIRNRTSPQKLLEHNDLLSPIQGTRMENSHHRNELDKTEELERLLKESKENHEQQMRKIIRELEISNKNLVSIKYKSQGKIKQLEKMLVEYKNANENLKEEIDVALRKNSKHQDYNHLKSKYKKALDRNKELRDKWDRYKSKLKRAINIISELNNLLGDTTKIPNSEALNELKELTDNESITKENCTFFDFIGSNLRCGDGANKMGKNEIIMADMLLKFRPFEDDLLLSKKHSWSILEDI